MQSQKHGKILLTDCFNLYLSFFFLSFPNVFQTYLISRAKMSYTPQNKIFDCSQSRLSRNMVLHWAALTGYDQLMIQHTAGGEGFGNNVANFHRPVMVPKKG